MPDLSSPQYQDVRTLTLGGNLRAKKQAVYVEELGGWMNIQQLYADEKAAVLQAATNVKTKSVDFRTLYGGLYVYSLRYPHPEAAPIAPVEPVAPSDFDEGGNKRPISPEEEEKYQEARQIYLKALADFQHPYPMDHPQAGELVFKPVERDMVTQTTPSPILDAIAEPAFTLSGFKKEEIAEKKAFFGKTVEGSMTTGSPRSSGEQTLTNS